MKGVAIISAVRCFNLQSGFKRFREEVRQKGGIWASGHVYFSQTQQGYSAGYMPKYPEHDSKDKSIYYNWVNDQWTETDS